MWCYQDPTTELEQATKVATALGFCSGDKKPVWTNELRRERIEYDTGRIIVQACPWRSKDKNIKKRTPQAHYWCRTRASNFDFHLLVLNINMRLLRQSWVWPIYLGLYQRLFARNVCRGHAVKFTRHEIYLGNRNSTFNYMVTGKKDNRLVLCHMSHFNPSVEEALTKCTWLKMYPDFRHTIKDEFVCLGSFSASYSAAITSSEGQFLIVWKSKQQKLINKHPVEKNGASL